MSIERNTELLKEVHDHLPAGLSVQLYIDEARWTEELARLQEYIRVLEANTSKSVVRRVKLQTIERMK